jgi:PhnB protein
MQITTISTSIEPWLSVRDGVKAVEFYKAAFGAIEVYRLDVPDGTVVAKLSIDGAGFWISDESTGSGNISPVSLGESTVRMILTVADPDSLFERVLKHGATEIFPVGVAHGWKLGRLADPFGHHWEIGHPVAE